MLFMLILASVVWDAATAKQTREESCRRFSKDNLKNSNFCFQFNDELGKMIQNPCVDHHVAQHPDITKRTSHLEIRKSAIAQVPAGDRICERRVIDKKVMREALRKLKLKKCPPASLEKIQYFLQVYASHIIYVTMVDDLSENCMCKYRRSCFERNREIEMIKHFNEALCQFVKFGVNIQNHILPMESSCPSQKDISEINLEMNDLILHLNNLGRSECDPLVPDSVCPTQFICKSKLKRELIKLIRDLMKVVDPQFQEIIQLFRRLKRVLRKSRGQKRRKSRKRSKKKNTKGKKRTDKKKYWMKNPEKSKSIKRKQSHQAKIENKGAITKTNRGGYCEVNLRIKRRRNRGMTSGTTEKNKSGNGQTKHERKRGRNREKATTTTVSEKSLSKKRKMPRRRITKKNKIL